MKLNTYKIVTNGADDSNGSKDKIINVSYTEIHSSQVYFVGIFSNQLKYC